MKIYKKLNILPLILILLAALSPVVFAESALFSRDLVLGSSGNDVSVLQQYLIGGGFLKIPAPTGYFGAMTRTALSLWQTKSGIFPTAGYFGSISRLRLTADIQQGVIVPPLLVASTPTVVAASGLPVRLKIPKISVDAGFQDLGLKSDGTMAIPGNIYDAGWFTGSVRPGESGSSIITGHVAQIRNSILTKPGIFYDLNKLQIGDKLAVVNDKGETINFIVRETRLYDPAADAADVFAANDGGAHLNLITCEGTWNQAQLSYSKRLVVFTDKIQ